MRILAVLLQIRNLALLALLLSLFASPARAQYECSWAKVGTGCGACYGFQQGYWRQYGYSQCFPCSSLCFGFLTAPSPGGAEVGIGDNRRTADRTLSCNDDPIGVAASRAIAANHWYFNLAVTQSVIAEVAAVNAPAASTLLAFARLRNFPGDKRYGTVGYGSLPTLATVMMELQDRNAELAKWAEQLPPGHGAAVTYSARQLPNGTVRIELRTTVVTDDGGVVREVGTPVWVDAVVRGVESVELRHLGARTFENLEVVRWGQLG